MTDEASTEIPADAESVAVGAGIASDPPLGEPEAPKSAREIMDAELSKIEAAKEEDPKPKAEPVKAKEEPATVEKPAVVAKGDGVKPAAVPGEQVAKPSEGKAPEPPARFMPAEKELWRHVPNQLKSAVARIEREYAAEAETYQASKQFHEELREYDDLAKRTGTTVKEALKSYVELEQSFAKDPEGTLPRLLQKVNMNPMQAVLAVLKSAGATPQQFAEHVRMNPGQYQGQAVQPMRQPAQPAPDPMASRAYEEVQELKHHLVRQEVLTNVVDPFRAEHPRFDELQEDIAFFLNSGKIPTSMDDYERLAAAYDMADRINPASYRDEPQAATVQPTALVNPVAGKKSIKGAPTGGKAPAMRTPSIKDALIASWPAV
jgi:hypothetical protein